MNVAAIRALFPGTAGRAYLDAASVGLMPTPAETAIQQLVHEMVHFSARDTAAHHVAIARPASKARREIAQLIGAAPDDIALVESTTQGLEILAGVIPLKHGDKVLVGETEYLGVAVPWVGKRATDGIEIEVVPSRQGRLLVEDYARAVDGRTRLILLSSVQWNSGYRADVAGFSELARQRNLFLVIDAIQHVGPIHLDVSETPIDFVCCGGHKWLNAPVGRGFLYVNPQVLDRLKPPPRGYLNIVPPQAGWAEYFATPSIPAVREYEFVRGARSFEIGGMANNPGNAVLAAAVGLLNEVGRDEIEKHVLDLTDLLMEKLRRAGATIVSPPERECRSGIVTFTLGQGPDRDRALLQQLLDRRIVLSQRYTAGIGGLRAGVHLFTNEDDVNLLADAVAGR